MTPRGVAVGALALAGFASLAQMSLGHAHVIWMGLQSAAIGVALLILLLPARWTMPPALVLIGAPLLLALTLVQGQAVDGVMRWLSIGLLRVHVGHLVIAALLVVHGREASWRSMIAVAVCAALIAAQPDRGTAIAIVAGAAAVALLTRSMPALFAAAVAVAALAVTIVRADPLAPLAMVEDVLVDSWGVAIWLGAMVAAAAVAAIGAPLFRAADRRTAITFAAAWAGLFVASLVGPYPVPLIGFGMAAWIGWALSLRMVLSSAARRSRSGALRFPAS